MIRLCLSTLALLGLLAMHGLGTHGTHGAPDDGAAPHHATSHAEPLPSEGPVDLCGDGCGEHAGLFAAALCVVVLLAAATLTRPRRGVLPGPTPIAALRRAVAPPAADRRARSPDPITLSILRC